MILQPDNQPRQKQSQKIRMSLDIQTINILCRYVLSSSSYLRIANLLNLRKLINILDPRTYENDPDKVKRIRFIKKALEARIDYSLLDMELIKNHICSGLDFEVDFIDFNQRELTANEIMWVHNLVSESLQYDFVYEAADQLLDICTRVKSSDYSHRGEIVKELENRINLLNNQFRVSRNDDSLTDMMFSLRNEVFDNVIQETYNLISNPSRRLITGMQGLNDMINGGFESGRVYMFLGITGIGKSVTLLNLAYQIKKYNTNYVTKDPTKTPCIVILTMENTVVETITRLFDMTVESSMGMANYPLDEVLRKLKEEGRLVLNEESPIDIVIKYKPNKSVDTTYLYSLCDDLEDDGYEVICLIQDHVKRIRSVYNNQDLRIQLGDIVNEFKIFAAEKDIPVITNSHLNRDAASKVEEDQTKARKTDVTMKLGKSNAGESFLMLDNLDCGIIINIDYDQDNNKYMVFKSAKMREKVDRTYIAQPFVYGSGIRLLEDYGGVPMFRDFLHLNGDVPLRNNNIKTSSSNVLSNANTVMLNNQNQNNAFSAQPPSLYSFDDDDGGKAAEEELIKPNIIRPIRFVQIDQDRPDIEKLNALKQKLHNKGSS